MPANEKSYENGKIYRIWSLNTDKIYIGSTCDTLSNRFCQHKKSYKQFKNGKGQFCSSFNLFDLVGVENCKIELEFNFPCENKTKLNKEEGRIQRLNKDIIVNKFVAGRTHKEHYQENKQAILEKDKQHYQANKPAILENKKQHYQANKEKISENKKQYYQANKEKRNEKSKEYRLANKEKINEKAKEYRQANKEKIHQKFNCECGGKYAHQNKSQHEKTIKHQNYIKNTSV